MILIDTSVWIDVFAERDSPATLAFEFVLRDGPPVAGDLIVVELLRGFRDRKKLRLAEAAVSQFELVTLCGPEVAHKAAANYRVLRERGITVRGTIDLIIATWCIENGVALLHNDRDFDPIEKYLGLICLH